jgi:hypothetical protein
MQRFNRCLPNGLTRLKTQWILALHFELSGGVRCPIQDSVNAKTMVSDVVMHNS